MFLALMANGAGQSFLLVVLPPLGRRLGFADIETGAILSASALLLMIAAPVWGYLAERIGRRPVLMIALAGAMLAPLAFGFIVGRRLEGIISGALGLLLVARAGQALLSAGILPASQAYVADITAPKARAGGMGSLGAAYGLGAIIGSALAWRIGGSDVVLAFLLLSGLAGLAFASVALLAPETRRGNLEASSSIVGLNLSCIWPFFGITLVSISAYSIVQQVVALRLQDAMGFASDDSIARAGLALMATASAMIVVQGGVLRTLSWRPETMLGAGSLLATIALLLAALARDYTELFGALLLLGVALGLMLPGNLASLSLRSGPSAQAKVAGFNVVGQGLGLAIGPLSGAALHQCSPQMPFLAAAVLLTIASALSIGALRIRRFPATSDAIR
ncbi:MFS transporter [Labrys sp. ZIDIC5]|uniref:MFS transporter n=1 Tax=Labrys sedimenti TaxID=3106036 RepID=UPI002ACAECB9|nr:MFS transporter [Labrys sp. ZIDIC5]MDZ5454607.1 MFS transporter [Labrys sp. ZIDIC5]